MFKALIVDDDRASVERIDAVLRLSWPDGCITWLEQGMHAVEVVREGPVDLVVLRVGRLMGDAHDVIALIRRSSDVPIVAVCPVDDQNAWVRSVELGADEYVVEPFSPVELLARIKAVVGRGVECSRLEDDTLTFEDGDLVFDVEAGRAWIIGSPICLTRPEVRLLGMLLTSSRVGVTPHSLSTRLWGIEDEGTTYLRVYVRRLRERLGPHLSTSSHCRERTRS